MYELLSGQVPFTGADPWAAMEAHLREQPVALRHLRPDVGHGLEGVVMTAMRRHREHRYPDAAALLADLDRLETLDGGAAFDLSPEAPITTPVGGAESAAILRLILVVMFGFLAVAAAAIGLSVLLH